MGFPSVKAVGAIATDLTGGMSLTPAVPAHVADDILVAVAHNAVDTSGMTTATSGWASLGARGGVGTTSMAVFWKRATASGTAGPTITSTSTDGFAFCFVMQGCITTGTPFGGVTGNGSGAAPGTTTPDISSIGSFPAGDKLMMVILAHQDDTAFASGYPPSGWTNDSRQVSASGTQAGFAVASKQKSNTTSESSITLGTLATAEQWLEITFYWIGTAAAPTPLPVSGTVTPTGGVGKAVSQTKTGNMPPTGALRSTISRAFAGAVSSIVGLLNTLKSTSDPLRDGMISWWAMDEASGNAVDSHGTNHLTDNNTVGTATGKVADARDFVKANTEYFSAASNSDLVLGDIDFTYAMWVKPRQVETYNGILSKSSASPMEHRLSIFPTGQLVWELSSTGSGYTGGVGTPASFLSNGNWYFVVIWHDSVADTVNLQINNATPLSAAFTGGVSVQSNPFFIGHAQDTDRLDGLLDEVGFWKRVLTTTERTYLYNSGNGRSYAQTAGAIIPELVLDGLVTPSSSLANFIDAAKTGAVTPAAVLGNLIALPKAGTVTPLGILQQLIVGQRTGTVTPVGVLAFIKSLSVALAGTVTPVGSLTAIFAKFLSIVGLVTPTAILAKAVQQTKTADLATSGSIRRTTATSKLATVTPSGVLAFVGSLFRSFTGTVTPAGSLSTSTTIAQLLNLAGSVTPSAILRKAISMTKTANLTFSGSIRNLIAKGVTSIVTPAGDLLLAGAGMIQRSFAGTVTAVGSLARAVSMTKSGDMVTAGTLRKQIAKQFAGGVTPSAILGAIYIAGGLILNLSGTVTPVGSLVKSIGKRFASLVTAIGVLLGIEPPIEPEVPDVAGRVTIGHFLLTICRASSSLAYRAAASSSLAFTLKISDALAPLYRVTATSSLAYRVRIGDALV